MSGRQSHGQRATDVPSWLFSLQRLGTLCVLAGDFGRIFASLRCHPITAVSFIENKLNLLYNKTTCSGKVSREIKIFMQNKGFMVKYIWEMLG